MDDYRFVYMGPKGSWYCVIIYHIQLKGCKSLYPNLESVFCHIGPVNNFSFGF